jgi:hypothetical protein
MQRDQVARCGMVERGEKAAVKNVERRQNEYDQCRNDQPDRGNSKSSPP